jgi:type II secretory pathway pseudopilin PulG
MQQKNNVVVPVVILLASFVLGGFYFATRYMEQQSRLELERLQQTREQEAKTETKEALRTCLENAQETYASNWFQACKTANKATDDCKSLYDLTFEEYMKKYPPSEYKDLSEEKQKSFVEDYISTYRKNREDCLCGLTTQIGSRIDDSLKDDKADCFRRYQ